MAPLLTLAELINKIEGGDGACSFLRGNRKIVKEIKILCRSVK